MRRSTLLIGSIALLGVVACSRHDTGGSDTTRLAAAVKVGETHGVKTPESVRYDPDLDVFYISNVNGNPAQHDDNGFIAVVRADTVNAAPRILVQAGKNGVTLDAPKGLALVGDTLWVADIDHVRAYDRRTGAKIADIDLSPQHAVFLNDVAVGGDGAIYVTDTGPGATGAPSQPGQDRIFKIAGRTATAISVDSLDSPNGITWDKANGRFILAPMGGKSVETWKPGDKAATTLATGPGQYDGVEVLGDGRILVSSWADSSVNLVQNGRLSRLVSGVSGPADIGVDTKRGVLAVPRFNDDKIEYYKLP